MLSILTVLHQLFQPYNIAREAAQVLKTAMEHIRMDDVFKDNYIDYVFAGLEFIEPAYDRQVKDLPLRWEEVSKKIDRDDFYLTFSQECMQLGLPFPDYDLDSAFDKALTIWADKLMIAIADKIIKFYEDEDIFQPVVYWDNGEICVKTDLCKNYRNSCEPEWPSG